MTTPQAEIHPAPYRRIADPADLIKQFHRSGTYPPTSPNASRQPENPWTLPATHVRVATVYDIGVELGL
ncbi:hypothetical protein [Corynebacterium durum]|uniref:hypothetical protein n=1 Tax=Corynebacterium durum TaxID=61592 RepID=UPI0028EE0E49|nr:hypothetical protein [Corynebacterium durum]